MHAIVVVGLVVVWESIHILQSIHRDGFDTIEVVHELPPHHSSPLTYSVQSAAVTWNSIPEVVFLDLP